MYIFFPLAYSYAVIYTHLWGCDQSTKFKVNFASYPHHFDGGAFFLIFLLYMKWKWKLSFMKCKYIYCIIVITVKLFTLSYCALFCSGSSPPMTTINHLGLWDILFYNKFICNDKDLLFLWLKIFNFTKKKSLGSSFRVLKEVWWRNLLICGCSRLPRSCLVCFAFGWALALVSWSGISINLFPVLVFHGGLVVRGWLAYL